MTPLNGAELHELGRRLWPIHRSITGDGVRETLAILKEFLPDLVIHEVPSGTKVFDWTIPDEWNIHGARLIGPDGDVVVNHADNNLHVVGYSIPIDTALTLDELQPHLHSIPDQPDAVPFVTSYYNPNWGFCLTQRQRDALRPGTYRAIVETTLEPGTLTYGELVLSGKVEDEIFISTYLCHPSMANNELSGPLVTTGIARQVMEDNARHYTYRFAFTPESIGAITYASTHLKTLRQNVVAGFQLTCIGDDRHYTYLASRKGDHRLDRIAKRVMRDKPGFVEYSYLARGSDERTYGAPGIDLPFISIMRTRYGDYPEYHSSEDDLKTVVTPSGLQGGMECVLECIEILEREEVLRATCLGEPQLGRRGLYHQMLNKGTSDEVMLRTNVLAYADGTMSEVDIAELLGVDLADVRSMVLELRKHELLASSLMTPIHRSSFAGSADVTTEP